MNKIFEQCTVDGELTPELINRKRALDAAMAAELRILDSTGGRMWVNKEVQAAEIRHKYEYKWEQELIDAGYFIRPTFESVDRSSFADWYEELNKIN